MDDLERRIRAANPHPVERDDKLSERAQRELALLLTDTADLHSARARWRRPLFATIATAALMVTFAVIASVVSSTHVAMASPPLLVPSPMTGDTTSVIERLVMLARSGSESSATDVIVAETWSADITLAPGSASTFVQSREVIRLRTADLAGEITVLAGEVRWGSVPPDERPQSPGTELERQTFGAGEFPLLFSEPPPNHAGELSAYFAQYVGSNDRTSAGELFRAIMDIRNEWQLTGLQTAAILEFIKDLPDVAVLGEVTDRLGRPGVAVFTDSRSDGAFQDVLIFDQTTGRLLSAEQIYLGGLTDVSFPAPTVIDYTAWKE